MSAEGGAAGSVGARAWDVLVVGGGPAGLLAAGRAAMLGARVLLLEKMEKPARKLRITGKGRANITNMRALEEQLKEIHPEPRFLRQAFQAFFNRDLIELLRGQGVETKVERGDRVFPASDLAWDVAEGLVAWAKAQGVEILPRSRVEGLLIRDGAFMGVEVSPKAAGRVQALEAHGAQVIQARCGILATGGRSYPATGSTGDGHRFAEATGHRIEALRPSLVRIDTRPAHVCAEGLTLKNVRLTLWIAGKKRDSEFGEVEFTAKGLAGACVLRLSRRIVEAMAAQQHVEVALDLKPALDQVKLEARLQREAETLGGGSCRTLLQRLLPAPLVEVFCGALGVDPGSPVARIQGAKRKQLLNLLKEMRFEVTAHGGWEEAIVTAGGVSLKDIDPRTMASRKIENLYFAGEVVDLDANTGGFNLQIAFSTGWLAGESASRKALEPPSGILAEPGRLALAPGQDQPE